MLDAAFMSGKCHCGSVKFNVHLVNGLETARRCNCSYCRMRGAVAVSAEIGELDIFHGLELLTEYKFNTGSAKHYFCSVCGIYTHHQRRSNSNQYGINASCLEGVSPFDFISLPVIDGLNHPSDNKTGGGIIGHLLFIPKDRSGSIE
jgi:hypothetical protein